MQQKIDQILRQLKKSPKKTLVALAATANVNNPSLYISTVRKTEQADMAAFIFKDLATLPKIIKTFDGVVDTFLIDCEVKDSPVDLQARALTLIQQSKTHIYKPNDITIDALDSWLATLQPTWTNKNVLVFGAGNIGSKISLRLLERGANITLVSRDVSKAQKIAAGFAEIQRGTGTLTTAETVDDLQKIDLILGCTPGIPVIDAPAVEKMASDGIIIDVGNGTLTASALATASQKNISAYCLTPDAGLVGFLACWQYATTQLNNMQRRKIGEKITLISPGILGDYGDVIVDNVAHIQKIIGVCDGKGDLLPAEKSKPFIQAVRAI